MGRHFDLAVVGLGAVGVAALDVAAAAGLSVIGIEQYEVGHDRGASGGESRIFRLLYREGADYLGALRWSRRWWLELATGSGERLFRPTGTITIGPPGHPGIRRLLQCARQGELQYQILDAADARRRWPGHRLADDDVVVFDPAGGLLEPGAAIRATAGRARARGAQVLDRTRVRTIEALSAGCRLDLDNGEQIFAARVIVAAGAWTGRLIGHDPAVELRQIVLQWFPTDPAADFGPNRFPVGFRHLPDLDFSFFPQLGGDGIKINWYLPKLAVPQPECSSLPAPGDYAATENGRLDELFRGVSRHPAAVRTYVESFTADHLPRVSLDPARRLLAVWGLSGQGFKFSPALGRFALGTVVGDTSPDSFLDRTRGYGSG